MPISYYPAAAADFDADGHVDLVVDSGGLSASSQLLILPGKGDGTLLPAVQYGTGRRDSSPPSTVSDVDGDGRPDVITANRWSSTLSLLLSRAEGGPQLRRAVSAASGTAIVAPDSLATLFGSALAAATERADPPWPASLGGIRLEVTDSAGATRLAPLLYVSPTQINFQVPSGTASGEAEISILGAVGSSPGGTMLVNPVAPGLFLSPTPFGPPHPAAVAILVESDGSQTVAPLCYPLQADCFPSEIPQSDGQVLADQRSIYVALFGTGFRNAASVTCSFHGAPVPVEYAGPQAMPGVDQINVRLPPGTRVGGTGVVFTVDGVVSNAVWP